MAINMMCEKSSCKHYFEDCCMRNLQEERIHINANGYCQTYESGVNQAYADMEKMFDEEQRSEDDEKN